MRASVPGPLDRFALTRSYVLTGPPGSGKSSVLSALRDLGQACVDEPAREVIAEQRAIDPEPIYKRDPKLFCDLMIERAILDFHRADRVMGPVFFDRGIPDMIAYAELFGLDTTGAEAAARANRYEDVVFVLPGWREIYVTDEDRTIDYAGAQVFGDLSRKWYADLGYALVNVPRGSPEQRARFVIERAPR